MQKFILLKNLDDLAFLLSRLPVQPLMLHGYLPILCNSFRSLCPLILEKLTPLYCFLALNLYFFSVFFDSFNHSLLTGLHTFYCENFIDNKITNNIIFLANVHHLHSLQNIHHILINTLPQTFIYSFPYENFQDLLFVTFKYNVI